MSIAHDKYVELQSLRNQPPPTIDPGRTALVVIDMQAYFLDPASPLSQACEAQVPGVLDDYHARGRELVEPSLVRLASAFRALNMPVLYTTVASERSDGADLGHVLRLRNEAARDLQLPPYIPPRDDPWAAIVPTLEPQQNDIVVNKTTYGAFASTGLESTLRNLGVTTLVIGGVVTNVCVETTARDACDRGFEVIVIEDACAAFSPEAHDATMLALKGPFASVVGTEVLLSTMVS